MSTAPEKNDESLLVHRAFRGDTLSFQRLVEEHQSAVYNLCLRYVGPADAEDAAQETFIRAFIHKDKFTPDRGVLPWLLTVARHLCLDKIRAAKRMDPIDSPQLHTASGDPDPHEELSQKQQLAIIQELMATLPEGQREAVMLADVEEMSYQETADVLDVPIGTVMTWLHRGRGRLKDLLVKKQKQHSRIFSVKGA